MPEADRCRCLGIDGDCPCEKPAVVGGLCLTCYHGDNRSCEEIFRQNDVRLGRAPRFFV